MTPKPNNIPVHPIHFVPSIKTYVTNPDVLPIKGMSYISDFLTVDEQKEIWDTVYSNPFSTVIHRRQQFYGETYYHTTPNISSLQPLDNQTQLDSQNDNVADLKVENGDMKRCWTGKEAPKALPLKLFDSLIEKLINAGFFTKEDPPTQILVNEYSGPMGISNHYDDDKAFGDTIATISLGKPIWLNLQLPERQNNVCKSILKQTKVFLEPGSLFVMQTDARYVWRHGISNAKWIRYPDNTPVRRDDDYVRVSLTIRKLLDGRKRVTKTTTDWLEIPDV